MEEVKNTENIASEKNNTWKACLLTYFKGVAMGASDVVPGVSGGTIALITGIYERLLTAIKNINPANIKLFFKGEFRQFWQNVDGTFLVSLLLGIATSFLLLAKLITFLIVNYPTFVWAFFFGLIIASTIFVGRTVKWNWKTLLSFVIFTVISFLLTSPTNAPLSPDSKLWFIFICGMVAICAMILPGISGSFILVLLGQYFYIMQALTELDIVVLLVFMVGAVIGILTFANVLSWLFKHYEMITLAALTGFMFGSLNKIWPWKHTLTTYIDNHGTEMPLTQQNIWPQCADINLVYTLLLIGVGVAIIFVIEGIAHKIAKQ